MAFKNNNIGASSLRRRAAWIALLPIGLLQLTIAVHQFEHIADYVDGPCDVCVQLDRIDAAVDHATDTAPVQSIDFVARVRPAVAPHRGAVRNFDSRAPPLSVSRTVDV